MQKLTSITNVVSWAAEVNERLDILDKELIKKLEKKEKKTTIPKEEK